MAAPHYLIGPPKRGRGRGARGDRAEPARTVQILLGNNAVVGTRVGGLGASWASMRCSGVPRPLRPTPTGRLCAFDPNKDPIPATQPACTTLPRAPGGPRPEVLITPLKKSRGKPQRKFPLLIFPRERERAGSKRKPLSRWHPFYPPPHPQHIHLCLCGTAMVIVTGGKFICGIIQQTLFWTPSKPLQSG